MEDMETTCVNSTGWPISDPQLRIGSEGKTNILRIQSTEEPAACLTGVTDVQSGAQLIADPKLETVIGSSDIMQLQLQIQWYLKFQIHVLQKMTKEGDGSLLPLTERGIGRLLPSKTPCCRVFQDIFRMGAHFSFSVVTMQRHGSISGTLFLLKLQRRWEM